MPTVDHDLQERESEGLSDGKREDILRRCRQWLETQPHLPYITDEMLLRFNHSCYFDLDRTKDCIESYYTLRSTTPEIFANRDVTRPELVLSTEVLYNAVMPKPDPRGYRIICNCLKDPDPAKYNYADSNKVLTMTIDASCIRYGSAPGLIIVHDMKGAKLTHLSKCSMSIMKKLTQYNQDACPVRLKEIHILNTVTWVDKLLLMLKPFIKKELFNTFNFYTSENADLIYKKIPKEYLPKDYGGTEATLEELNAENTKYLASLKDFFAEEDKFVVDDSKRPKGITNMGDVEGTFRKLDID